MSKDHNGLVTFLISLWSITGLEFLKMVTVYAPIFILICQLLIAILTIIYLIRKILKQ